MRMRENWQLTSMEWETIEVDVDDVNLWTILSDERISDWQAKIIFSASSFSAVDDEIWYFLLVVKKFDEMNIFE